MLKEIIDDLWSPICYAVGCLFLACACTLALADEAGASLSYRELRYEGVVGQTEVMSQQVV